MIRSLQGMACVAKTVHPWADEEEPPSDRKLPAIPASYLCLFFAIFPMGID